MNNDGGWFYYGRKWQWKADPGGGKALITDGHAMAIITADGQVYGDDESSTAAARALRDASDVPGHPATFDVTSYGRHEARGFNPSPVASAITGIPIHHWPGSWMMDNPIGRPKRKVEFKDVRGSIVCTRWI